MTAAPPDPTRELYEAIFEKNTAVKLLIDPEDGQIVDANLSATRFYGWSREELIAMRIAEINTLSAEEVRAELDRARQGQRTYFRFRHRIASGDVRHVEVHSGTVELGGRQLLLSIVQDVSDRHVLEDQLRQAQKLEAIGQLAGGVAHDFNNLLTVITGSAQLLGRQLPRGEKSRDHLEDILRAARSAGELTRQLLAFGGRQRLEPRPVQLNDVVFGLTGLLSRALGDGIQVEVNLAPSLPRVSFDPGQLEHVLMNLALNARDAMSGSGRLAISTERRGGDVALIVRDDGPGMSEATRSRLFEPFFTTKALGQGSGLGLATVYGIVTQSGATISVESELGAGATFTVLLPVRARPTATVLLVEDLDDVRDILAECMEDAGFRVIRAGSAEDGVVAGTDPGEVDALVADVVMPGRSGVELARELRSRNPRLAVLLISGDAAVPGKALEGARFLRKPFSGRDLLRELDSALDRSG